MNVQHSSKWALLACGLVLLVCAFSRHLCPTHPARFPPPAPSSSSPISTWKTPATGSARRMGPAHRRIQAPRRRAVQNLHRRHSRKPARPPAKSSARLTPSHPDLVVWPESPAPFFREGARFKQAMRAVALAVHAPLIVGGVGTDSPPEDRAWRGLQLRHGLRRRRPRCRPLRQNPPRPLRRVRSLSKDLLFFAHKLTGQVVG